MYYRRWKSGKVEQESLHGGEKENERSYGNKKGGMDEGGMEKKVIKNLKNSAEVWKYK